MSLLKAIKAQLGLSNTPANNFTITAEADNGTLKLARGNAGATTQDIFTVDINGAVSFPNTANTQLGVGQTWQNVTGSRALDTNYTNNTNKPIQVAVYLSMAGVADCGYVFLVGTVGTSRVYSNALNMSSSLSAVVPPGTTYMVDKTNSGTASVISWSELR